MMISIHKHLSVFILAGFIAVLLTPHVLADDPSAGLAKERAALPTSVFDLFYAIKNSLDYGAVGEMRQPLPDYKQYSRVTQAIIDTLSLEWEVVGYSVSGAEYEIIVQKKDTPLTKYKGSRMEKFKWEDGGWVSLGGYLYI